uniref:Replication stress response regulator SDE2 n=1 Tax=Scophthalmus maximus TaxID=52904 RepID=A0A8D3DL55_SCOMX
MEVFVTAPRLRREPQVFPDGSAVRDVLTRFGVCSEDFYVIRNGRVEDVEDPVQHGAVYNLQPRLCGGKGGFGSMLRALGAQIEKTTNREACRDLSGRRLRDVNHEKEMADWLKKQAEREAEKEQRRLERLKRKLSEPKHQFTDPEYQQQCHDLFERLEDSVLKGEGAGSGCSPRVRHQRNVLLPYVSSSSSSSSENQGPPETRASENQGPPETRASENQGPPETRVSENQGPPETRTSENQDPPETRVSENQGPPETRVSENQGPENQGPPETRVSENQGPPETRTSENQGPPETRTSENQDPPETRTSENQGPPETRTSENQGPPETRTSENQDPGTSGSEQQPRPRSLQPLDLSSVSSIDQLTCLGLDVLKGELMSRGLKCGGSLTERAARLFSVKGLSLDQIDPALLARPGKARRK